MISTGHTNVPGYLTDLTDHPLITLQRWLCLQCRAVHDRHDPWTASLWDMGTLRHPGRKVTEFRLSYRAVWRCRGEHRENLLSPVHGRVHPSTRSERGGRGRRILRHRFTAYGVDDTTRVHSVATQRPTCGQTLWIPNPRFGVRLTAERVYRVQAEHATASQLHLHSNHRHYLHQNLNHGCFINREHHWCCLHHHLHHYHSIF